MNDDSLIEDVREVAALLGRSEDRAFSTGMTTDDLVRVMGEARGQLEAALLLRGEALGWTTPGPDRPEPAAR
ncbi:MAG: hypothetical protein KY447_07255 [Actinobacteria bacterium]|nr:hypothetical protein [Actinomycetota bacterium]